MSQISEEHSQVSAKLAIIGPAGAGKQEIISQLAKQQGSGPLHQRKVGETEICQASWEWAGIPAVGWTMRLTAFTTIGPVDFNAITEMLLDGVDGIIFVAPVDPKRGAEIKESLQRLIFNLKRNDRDLSEIPITLHYHRADLVPGFDPATLDQFLGLAEGAVPRVVTRSRGDDLTASFASVVGQILNKIELPEEAI